MSITSSKLSVTLLVGRDKKTPVYFKYEDATKELRMLKVGEQNKVEIAKKYGPCIVKAQSSSYLKCDGAEHDIPAGNIFNLSRKRSGYVLKVKEKLTYSFITKIYKLSCSLSCLANHRDLK